MKLSDKRCANPECCEVFEPLKQSRVFCSQRCGKKARNLGVDWAKDRKCGNDKCAKTFIGWAQSVYCCHECARVDWKAKNRVHVLESMREYQRLVKMRDPEKVRQRAARSYEKRAAKIMAANQILWKAKEMGVYHG